MSSSRDPRGVSEVGLANRRVDASAGIGARLERAVFERARNLELERARTLAVVAALVWLAFGAFDVFASTKLELGPLDELLRIRAGVFLALVVLAAAARLASNPRPWMLDAGILAGVSMMSAGLGAPLTALHDV